MASTRRATRTNSTSPAKFSSPPPPFSRSSLPGPLKLQDHHKLQPEVDLYHLPAPGKLKRKAGVADFSAAHSEASPLVSPSSGGTDPFTFDWSPSENEDDDNASVTESEASLPDADYSFASTAKSFPLHSSRPTIIQTRPTHHFRRVSSDDADRFYRSAPQFQQRTYALQPIFDPPTLPSTSTLPVRAATINEGSHNNSSASTTSHTANLLVSQFPKPPQQQLQSPWAGSEIRKRKDISPPTVYHFRGASFEIVNPQPSLRLQDIETPAENDLERREYFPPPRPMANLPVEQENHSPPPVTDSQPEMEESHPLTTPQAPDNIDKSPRATPPRSLYDDLPSAYNSILSRARETRGPSPLSTDPTFPPVPIPPPYSKFRVGISPVKPCAQDTKSGASEKPARTTSLRRRFSHALRLKKHNLEDGSKSDEHDSKSLPQKPLGGSKHKRSASNPEGKDYQARDVETEDDASNEPTPGSNRHYYDTLSFFNDSTARSDSRTINPLMQHSTTGTPLKSHIVSDDNESNNSLIDAYKHGFNDSPTPGQGYKPHMNEALRVGLEGGSATGDILQGYNGGTRSAPPKFEIGNASTKESFPKPGMRSKLEAPQLRRSTSGLSQFSFGFDKDADTFDAASDQPVLNNQSSLNLRHAGPGVPPSHVGPTPPSKAGCSTYNQAFEEDASVATAYTDTRNLLRISSASLELGRGTGADNLSIRQNDSATPSSTALPFSSPANGEDSAHVSRVLSLPSPTEARRTSGQNLEGIIHQELKHLSSTSGISNLSANIFVFNNNSQENQREGEDSDLPSDVSSIHSADLEKLIENTSQENKENYVPMAAFSQNAVRPGISRLSPALRRAVNEPKSNIYGSNRQDEIENDSDDGFDWETVAESRPTMASIGTDHSYLADALNRDSLKSYRNVDVHPGNIAYQHSYRLHSPQSIDDPVLMPTYDFRNGDSFPHRNALAEPKSTIYTYNSPIPAPLYTQFTSSPTQIYGSPSKATCNPQEIAVKREAQTSNLSTLQWQRANLSVVKEQSESFTFDQRGTKLALNHHDNIPLGSEHSSDWLSSEPGPEVRNDGEDAYVNSKSSPKNLPSGIDSKLLSTLRAGDHRMGSSPLSARNSFNQFSRLGDKVNITGTPNGTNMREVGSSLVGSSSPVVPNSSPPAYKPTSPSTPITPQSPTRVIPRSSPLVSSPSSPLAQELFEYDEYHFGTGRWMNSRSTNTKVTDSFRDAMVAASRTDLIDKKNGRRSVISQHKLMEMALADRVSSEISLFVRPAPRGRHQRRSDGPLLPLRDASAQSPHLFAYRVNKKEAIEIGAATRQVSWIVFALCAVFPPLLITYGHGAFDRAICYITDGKVIELGSRQKRIARWAGYAASAVIILGLAVAFVVIRTVPNDLPK